MTASGGDANDPRTSIRALDPVDPSTPPPDGSRLLEGVLATSRPTRSRRRRSLRPLQLAPLGLGLALVAGVVAVAVSAGDGTGDEQEVAVGSGGNPIIHYVVRERWGTLDGPGQLTATHEHWQLEDGSRARTISHWEAEGPLQGTTSEDVVTRTQSLAYRPATDQGPETIIRYRASDEFQAIPEDPPPFEAPPIGGSPEVGDPRTVPDRLAAGDADVRQLADGTVRDIAVKQFQVGDCGDAPNAQRTTPDATVTVPQRAIVALARDTLEPVRVTLEPCSGETALPIERRILDYTSFEELAQTPANLELLELSPHPDVRVVDGIEIDKAEEREEAAGAAPTPTPTPMSTPQPPEADAAR